MLVPHCAFWAPELTKETGWRASSSLLLINLFSLFCFEIGTGRDALTWDMIFMCDVILHLTSEPSPEISLDPTPPRLPGTGRLLCDGQSTASLAYTQGHH